ncbi:MAG: hypothetical protein ACAH95_09530 [Fimbriimonas sp.]
MSSPALLQRQAPDVTVDKMYEGEGAKIEGVGVCSITPDSVSCWDMSGTPAPQLSERIRSYYLGQSQQEVSFRIGKKNRHLIVRSSGAYASLEGANEGERMTSNQMNYSSGDEPVLHWVGVAVEPDKTTGSIRATLHNLPGPSPIDIPFAKGAKGTYDGVTLELASWTEAKKEQRPPLGYIGNGGPSTEGKLWRIIYAVSQPNRYFTYSPLGKDRKPIQYVDDKGQPVSGVKYLEENPTSNRGSFPAQQPTTSKYRPVYFQFTGAAADGAMAVTTNIDPTYIGAVKVSSTRTKVIQINGFPLDLK